ncbi:alpha/beta-hydrolase [Thozetella sp. PMI_491]|nr:alpha/beta-hydrolase [Thozetella sp. PMI_491]
MRSDEIPQVSQVQLDVPGLGTVTGLSLNKHVCQYLGIPYAQVPGRFRRSIPTPAPWKDGQWDGTKLGPYCPQPPRDFYPVPTPARPWLEMPVADEFNCLNLNISVPCQPSQVKSPMPVMVFIHGGAFTYSMNSSPVYDGRILAATSAEEFDKPTIVITVNYRLGVYGFLAGRDLQGYNAAHSEEGVGNYGIWDQILALRWIQKHISAFGGDPARVTLFGQSAGAQSTNCHLLRDEPLFSSAILQSGLIRLCGVLSVDQYQAIYEKMLRELNIPLDLPPEQRLQMLVDADAARVTTAMASVYLVPVVTVALCDDGVLVPGGMPSYADYTEFKVPSWCPRIMMGDAKNECIIWNKSWDPLSTTPMVPGQDLATPVAPKVVDKMVSVLGETKAAQLAEIYGISKDMSPEEIFWALESMTTDGMYAVLIYFAQLSAPESIYAYHFNVPSPYNNAWGGLAHHSHDNVLIWGVLSHTLPPSQQQVGRDMAKAWVKFAHGEEPWERFSEGQKWMVFNDAGAGMQTRQENTTRNYDAWDKLHNLGLAADLSRLSDELCLRRDELIN